ncbi:MAG: thioredoxin domain-containing protein [Bdellovibrionales bacterium]
MAYRVFLALVLIVSAYFAFETIRFKFIQHSLVNADQEYVLGNPDGDVTFVKFLDYSCIYCRDAHPIIEQALSQDGRVKFLPKPVAILGEDSRKAALLAYAAGKQGKFAEMHDAIMDNFRVISDRVIQDLALEIGADAQQLIADYNSDAVLEVFEKNVDSFRDYNMVATPTYAVGPNILFTPNDDIGVQDFLKVFDEARNQ